MWRVCASVGQAWLHIRMRCSKHICMSTTVYIIVVGVVKKRKKKTPPLFHSKKNSSRQSIFMRQRKMHYIFREHILFYVGAFQVFSYWPRGLCE